MQQPINDNIIESKHSLDQLIPLLEGISTDEYTRTTEKFDHNSIGAHVRHILEFYLELDRGYATGSICYDDRRRDMRISEDPKFALQTLKDIQARLDSTAEDADIFLDIKNANTEIPLRIPSSLARELVYLVEHNTHHMALIRYMMHDYVESVKPAADFGYAKSTIAYQKSQS